MIAKNLIWKELSFIILAGMFLLFVASPICQDITRQHAIVLKLLVALPQSFR